MIVLFEPSINDDLSLFDCREPLGIEDVSSERAVEAFIVSVLLGAAGVDLDRLDANLFEPGL